MLKKSWRSLLLATTLTTSFASLATQYPLTVTDIDGQHVTINQEPQRVVLQDGRDIMSMALLDRDNPFHRLVAWNNLPKKQDTATWDLLKSKWPQSEGILDMGFSDKGDVELESILAKKPDLMIAQLRAKPALMENGVISKLNALHIPLVFVDYEINPAQNTAPSVDLLGKVLNREENAKAYTDFYRQHFSDIQKVTASITPKPTVFIEPIAGNTDACCFTHGHNGWGGLLEAIGAKNIGSGLLPGASGFVSLEKVISEKPDTYIMTGSKRGNGTSKILPFGYGASDSDIQEKAKALLSRTGIDQVPAIKAGQVYGVYHHFYNHPYNIVGMEYLAKAVYPKQFSNLNPDETYHYIVRHFTTLPDDNFVFARKLAN
ncbi:ABC transporter substrate-binding protein [Dickeya parazeae]|uniref:ABC transporter, substrate binding protein n=1 Tax=Dickeya zeae (strain Ech586) TaxID=590409 RepID=D2BTS8_DICZ5|nr:ABC transporter substrate-binding protein [Dickeya parazeae]ACZ77909.1 ABC transporter, substrate binding protein [Dickeya parazeae Ech586]MBP2838005.1 ABC transporter substrate-binding protein [Dickeya parazeae]